MLNTSLSFQEVVNSFRCIIYPYIFLIVIDMLFCYAEIMKHRRFVTCILLLMSLREGMNYEEIITKLFTFMLHFCCL